MDEQNEGSSEQNQLASSGKPDPIENPSLPLDSDRDGLINRQKILPRKDSYSTDPNRDYVSNLDEVVLETDPKSLDTNSERIIDPNELNSDATANLTEATEESSQNIVGRQSFTQYPSTPTPDVELNENSETLAQLPDSEPKSLNENTTETTQPSFVNVFHQRLKERSNLDINNATIFVRFGSDVLYKGSIQAVELNILTQDQQDLLQKSLDDPTGLKGELLITVNEQTIFQIIDGEVKIDSLGLVGNQQQSFFPSPEQAQAVSSSPAFNPPAAYKRYQQQTQVDSTVPATPASIDAYERIAQKALSDGLHVEQVKQVLKEDPFHQTLALGLGQESALRLTDHLLNSLTDQTKTNSLSSIANTDNPVAALESRVKNLESFNQHLSSQVEILSQKLEKLSQSKAFWSHSPGLNQFLGNVRDYVANTWLAARNSLRQKAGEVSLALVGTLALASTERFGEPTSGGNRVIDSGNGKRLSISREGDIKIGQTPQLQPASEYQRLLQSIDPKLPPSLQAKQIASNALKEKFTRPQIQSILSQSPKFKEIASKQGADKALQFVNVTLAAATRQNAIESQPQPQRSRHQQSQHQA